MRREKKSETLEVRLSYAKKQAFMAACRDQGTTASDAVRGFVDAYVRETGRVRIATLAKELSMTPIRHPLKSLGGALAAACAALAITAAPSAADDKLFKSFDRDADGRISTAELGDQSTPIVAVLDLDRSGAIERGEFKVLTVNRSVSDRVFTDSQGERVRLIQVVAATYDLSQEHHVSTSTQAADETIAVDADAAEVAALVARLTEKLQDAEVAPEPPKPPPAGAFPPPPAPPVR
ncbi:MAG: hypothetical protein ACFB2Z_08520 [Maricaulaceae bacterium]